MQEFEITTTVVAAENATVSQLFIMRELALVLAANNSIRKHHFVQRYLKQVNSCKSYADIMTLSQMYMAHCPYMIGMIFEYITFCLHNEHYVEYMELMSTLQDKKFIINFKVDEDKFV